MSINERVIQIYESLQIKQSEFARRINISPQTLNNQVKGKNGLSLATLELIANGFPLLNMRWLISGMGVIWLSGYQDILNTDNLIVQEPPTGYAPEFVVKEVHVPIGKRCSITGGDCYADRLTDMERELVVVKAELAILKKKKK